MLDLAPEWRSVPIPISTGRSLAGGRNAYHSWNAGGTTEGQTYERWLRVHNDTSVDLCYVYISHVGTNRWGRDILGNSCLSPGYYRTVDPGWQQGYCKVDMKFVFDDDDEVTRWDYNICVEEDLWLTED